MRKKVKRNRALFSLSLPFKGGERKRDKNSPGSPFFPAASSLSSPSEFLRPPPPLPLILVLLSPRPSRWGGRLSCLEKRSFVFSPRPLLRGCQITTPSSPKRQSLLHIRGEDFSLVLATLPFPHCIVISRRSQAPRIAPASPSGGAQ